MAKKVFAKPAYGKLWVSWKCPECHTEAEKEIELADVQGDTPCRCAEYCYCNGPEFREQLKCGKCDTLLEVCV